MPWIWINFTYFTNFIQWNEKTYLKEFHIWQRHLSDKVDVVTYCQFCVCYISLEVNAQSFCKFSEGIFNVSFWHKFTTRFFLKNSAAYKRNHILYNKVISILKKKYSILKLLCHPTKYKIHWLNRRWILLNWDWTFQVEFGFTKSRLYILSRDWALLSRNRNLLSRDQIY